MIYLYALVAFLVNPISMVFLIGYALRLQEWMTRYGL